MIRDGSVTSAEECQRRCQANPQCGYFTFFSDNNQCYLKSPQALSQRRTGPSVQTRISGPRDCGRRCLEFIRRRRRALLDLGVAAYCIKP